MILNHCHLENRSAFSWPIKPTSLGLRKKKKQSERKGDHSGYQKTWDFPVMKKQFFPLRRYPHLLLDISAICAVCLTYAGPAYFNGRHIQSQQDLSPWFLLMSICYPPLVENRQRFLACYTTRKSLCRLENLDLFLRGFYVLSSHSEDCINPIKSAAFQTAPAGFGCGFSFFLFWVFRCIGELLEF